MKFYLSLILLVITIALQSKGADRKTLSGKITDKKTGTALTGVTVYITDLKTGSVSDLNGYYKIENLPASRVQVQVSYVSYKLIVETIDLSLISIKDFELEESVAELHEVVITGLSLAAEKNRTPAPISTISPKQLQQVASTNIIDAIATHPGISQITTGSGIS